RTLGSAVHPGPQPCARRDGGSRRGDPACELRNRRSGPACALRRGQEVRLRAEGTGSRGEGLLHAHHHRVPARRHPGRVAATAVVVSFEGTKNTLLPPSSESCVADVASRSTSTNSPIPSET